MTNKEALEAELDAIDAEIEELSSFSSGFKLSAEIRRLRAALFSRESVRRMGLSEQFSSDHERAERIRTLQRERERVLEELAALEEPDYDDATESSPTQNQ